MADNILFKSGLASKLNDITKTAGQLLFAIDGTSGSIYLDKDSTTRIKMNLDATKLQNARAINGTPFDGTQNITTTKWGSKRTITISDNDGTNTQSNANIDGSANFTLKLPAIIKATLSGKASTAGHADTASSATTATTCTGNAETATKLQTARNIFGRPFDGTADVAGRALMYGDYNSDINNHAFTAALEIRENGLVGVDQTDIKYAPEIGFHWAGHCSGGLALGSDTKFRFLTMGGGIATLIATLEGNASTANSWSTARTLTIGNKEQSVKGDTNVSWSLHDILYNTSQIGVATSWDITTPGVYCVGSSSSFTGTNNPESSNGGLTPYPYGQLIVSRANWGGLVQFYISHRDSDSTSYGIKFRTGWDSSYVSTWSSILDSTNYTNYTVTKTGGGASGTWGINITGSAASVAWGNITGKPSFNYLPLSGGTLSGLLSAHGGISLNDSTPQETPQFILGIRAFADGGNIVWQTANEVSVGKASALTPITTTDKADGTNHWRRVWFSYIDNTTGRPAYDDRFVFQTSTGTLKAPVFSGNKLYASSTDSDAIHTIGGILASHLRIDNANSGGYIELREDGEGGTITLGGPNGNKWWEIDCYNSSELRIFSHDGSKYQFFVFGANGNLSAPSFSGNLNGNASTASALTPITDTDLASNADTWRRIWMSWSDNTTGRPAYDDRFAIQTSTGTLKAPIFSGDLNGNASSASLLYPNSSFSYYRNSFQYFNFSAVAGAAVGVNDAPTTQWWHMLRCSHWNDLGFYTDVAIPFNNNHIYYKRVMAGSVQNGGWVMVYDTQNIVYSASAPSGPLVGTIWLQPI